MSGYILGLHAGVNATACIGDHRRILHCVQEERLTREKGYIGFPHQAIDACLNAVGAEPSDLSAVAYGSRSGPLGYCSRRELTRRLAHLHDRRRAWRTAATERRLRRPADPRLADAIRHQLAPHGLDLVPIHCYDHHTTHAATAYYGLRVAPDEPVLVLTCDGFGDGACATVSIWQAGATTEVARTDLRNSLGLLYFWTTQAFGFPPHQDEYKLMGMAPYADPHRARAVADLYHQRLSVDGLVFRRTTPRGPLGASRRSIESHWPRLRRELLGRRFDDVFAGLQLFTEEILTAWTTNAIAATGLRDVLASGGVFMNVKANKAIAALPEVDSFQAFPSCGDESLVIGAYYQHTAAAHGQDNIQPLNNCYLGDDITAADAQHALARHRLPFTRPDDLAETVAALVSSGEPVAVSVGRMEFGARALGHRSILADPADPDIPRRLNHLVKRRDFWMPFAPVMTAARQHDYLRNPKKLPSPHMTMSFDTTDNARDLIAAVHPRDLTCRPQILPDDEPSPIADILAAFERRTGRAALLNTSLNLHGQPIARTADDAIAVLRGSDLRHLVLGPYLVTKPADANRTV